MTTRQLSKAEVESYYRFRIPRLPATSGGEWRVPCPIHDGLRNSLAINPETGRWKCHSECGVGGDVFEFEMRLTGCTFLEAVAAVEKIIGAAVAEEAIQQSKRIVATYEYTDENGKPLFEVVRWEPKDFNQRHMVNGEWAWNLKGVERVPYRLPALLAADEVILAEGEKDVHSLEEIGFTATTTPMGAKAWRSHYAKWFDGKRVILIPDNDEAGSAYEAAVRQSIPSAIVVRVPLPHKDVSDWLSRGGSREALLGLIKDAEVNPGLTNVEDDKPKHSPEPLKANKLADYIMQDNILTGDTSGNIWIYRPPIWKSLTEAHALHLAISYDNLESTSRRNRREAIDRIRDLVLREDEVFRSRLSDYEAPVRNGVLNLKTSTLRPHRPEDHTQTIVPWDFDPSAKCPVFMGILRWQFENDPDGQAKADLLQEFFGYLLLPHNRYKAVLILYGVPDSGKSKVLEAMVELVGHDNTCSIAIERMGDPRDLAPLKGKLLNAVGDMARNAIVADGGFKAVTGGDNISIRELYQPSEVIAPIAKHVFATNTLPSVQDDSDGTYNRFRIVEFRRAVPSAMRDPNLMDKIIAEMPGILAWAAHGAARLVENGGRFTDVSTSGELIEEHRREQNPVIDFVAEEMIKDEAGGINYADFRKRFREWNGRQSVSDKTIGSWRGRAGLRKIVSCGVTVIPGWRWKRPQL